MKRALLLFILILPFSFCFAQKPKKENLWNGTGKFILGTTKSVFGSDIKPLPTREAADSINYVREIYDYEYLPVKLNGYDFGGVKFKQLFLFFQKDKILNNFMLLINYSKKDSSAYLKQAEDDIEKLAFYLKSKLKRRGVKRYFQNNTNSFSVVYEWKKRDFTISLQVVQSKVVGSEFANVNLFFSKKE